MIKRNSKGQFVKSYFTGFGFKKGQPPWNKNKQLEDYPQMGFQKGHPQFNTGRTHFKKDQISPNRGKKLLTISGEKHWNWKNDNVGYPGIHCWLKKTFGNATKCENLDCPGRSKRFEYSLIKGKECERKRENFWMLCAPCHRKYDLKKD